MSWLDIVILVILAVTTFTGLRRGLIKSVLTLAGLIIGIILAGRLYTYVAGLLTFIQQEGIAEVVAFILILVVVMIIAAVAASLLKWFASIVMLGWANSLGGAVFGLILGAISAGALLTLWANFLGAPDVVADSGIAGILLDKFPAVLALLPSEFDSIRSFFQ
ncbi:MAG: CvpA family protein [Dehalococcoidales bacterium]